MSIEEARARAEALERAYRNWCRQTGLDPEETATAVAYEEEWERAADAVRETHRHVYDAQTGQWS